MRIPLDICATRLFADHMYETSLTPAGKTILNHAEEVSRYVRRAATDYYHYVRGEFLPPECTDPLESAVHASILHEVIERGGCTFEAVVAETDLAAGHFVADCTRDHRLPEARRLLEFRSRISEAPILSQIIVLCDTLCTIRDTAAWLPNQPRDVIMATGDLLPRWDEDLSALNQTVRYTPVRPFVKYARRQLTDLGQLIRHMTELKKPVRAKAPPKRQTSKRTPRKKPQRG